MKKIILIFSVLLICLLSRAEDITFNKDIRPIFKRYCAGCHFGSINYSAAYQNREKIYSKFVRSRQMPPKYISDRPSLLEVKLVRKWIENGAKK